MVVPGEKPASSAAANTNGLKAEPGLALGVGGAVERALGEVAAADQGAHVAGRRFDGDERRLQRGALRVAFLSNSARRLATESSANFCTSASSVV